MSRLLGKRAKHRVWVEHRANTRDAEGMRVPAKVGDRELVRCLSEPVREWSEAEEMQSLGLQVTNMLVIRARKWPGDINSHVIYKGEVYETVGVPQEFELSRRTRHWRITVKWIGKDGEPDGPDVAP